MGLSNLEPLAARLTKLSGKKVVRTIGCEKLRSGVFCLCLNGRQLFIDMASKCLRLPGEGKMAPYISLRSCL